MRKPRSKIFQKYMIRPIFHMAFTRAILGLTAALLWNEYVKTDAALSARTYAFLVLGALFLVMGWMAYLRLDGIKMPTFDKRLFEWKRKPKRIKGDLIDFVDEEVVSFDELETDEKDFCRLIANLVCGGFFLILAYLF